MDELDRFMVGVIPIVIIFGLSGGAFIAGRIEMDTMVIALILLCMWLELKHIGVEVE